jgi:hypothetical protein
MLLKASVVLALSLCVTSATAQVTPDEALLYFDFGKGMRNLGKAGGNLTLPEEIAINKSGHLEFIDSQSAHLDAKGTKAISAAFSSTRSLSAGGWFFCRRIGEQVFLRRGQLEVGPLGERLFRPSQEFVNFCLGTDQHGFLMGTINGNGTMPFTHVTICDVPEHSWQQLVVVKDNEGFHHFYRNGVHVHSDRASMWAPSLQAWKETTRGENETIHLAMPAGGLIGETWIVGRALTDEDVADDFRAKQGRYRATPPRRVPEFREVFAQAAGDADEFDREPVLREVRKLLGSFPDAAPSLEAKVVSEEDCGRYLRRKVVFTVQPDDRLPAWLLVPKVLKGRVPAVICFYGTTGGAGKDVTVGLSGRRPGTKPERNMSFALDVVEAGMIALAPDYLRDGERRVADDVPYDTKRFYEKFPDWSIHGKDIWDTMRAVDYLQSLEIVDPDQIGMMGHSYGGHSTIFAAALEPRIKVAVANGPVSAFREHGMHWAVPKGASNSQSLPALRPYILDPTVKLPVTFAQWTALIAPRRLWVGQAVGERRPLEESNYAYVRNAYRGLDAVKNVQYLWYAGDHDFPPTARAAAIDWFRQGFSMTSASRTE